MPALSTIIFSKPENRMACVVEKSMIYAVTYSQANNNVLRCK